MIMVPKEYGVGRSQSNVPAQGQMPLIEVDCRHPRALTARVDINRFRLCMIAVLGSLVVMKIAFISIVAKHIFLQLLSKLWALCIVWLDCAFNLRCDQHVPRRVHVSGSGSARII